MQRDTPTPPGRSRPPMIPAVLMMLITALALWPMAFVNPEYLVQGSSADELYHYPLINKLASEMPAFDYSDYSSATTPGYHTMLAFPRAMGIGYQGIRVIASVWTIALIGLMAWVVGKRFGFGGDLLVLPMMVTNYVLFPGMWLLPDNAGWLGVLFILLVCLRNRLSARDLALCGMALLALVFVRQVHIWVASIIWISAWVGRSEHTPLVSGVFSDLGSRVKRTMIAIGFTIPAFALLGYFVNLWGGLVPPTFSSEHNGANPATPGYILLQISVLSLFFAPVIVPRLQSLFVTHRAWVVWALVIGLVCGLAPHSSFSFDEGRYGGWWNLISKFPLIAERSPVYIAGSVAGAMLVVVWGSMLSRRDAWILGGAFVVFVLSQSVNLRAWQRYHEPMLLIMLVLIAARAPRAGACKKRLVFGSAALAIMLAAVTGYQLMEQVPRGITDPRVEALKTPADPSILNEN